MDKGKSVLLILQTGSFLVKDRRKTGTFFLAKIRALDGRKDRQNSSFCIKKARKFDPQRFNDKSARINTIFG